MYLQKEVKYSIKSFGVFYFCLRGHRIVVVQKRFHVDVSPDQLRRWYEHRPSILNHFCVISPLVSLLYCIIHCGMPSLYMF
jgi:hypothetical protein